jgi:putative colanic acid biosynthesis UDP-glucose lipid carrier transferase
MIQGKSPFRPDKEHLHHRLLLLGLTPKQTLFFFIGFTLFYLLLSIKIYYSPPFKALMLFLPGLFIFGLALKRLGFVEKRRLYLPRWKVKEQDELILPPFFRKKVAHLILILLSDVGAILASFFVFLHLKIQVTTIAAPLPFQLDELFLIMLVGYWILLFYFNNLYQVLWDTSRVERLFHLTRITAFGVFLLAVPALDFSAINLARIVNFIIYWGLLTIFTYLGRFIIISLERKYHILIFADKNAIIIGQNQTAEKIVADSKKRKDVFLNIVGSVSYTKKPGDLGDLRSLPLLINRYRVEEIIITEVENSAEDVYDVVAIAEGMGVNFKLTPEIYRQLFRSQPSLIGYPLIRLNLPQLNRWQKTMKRSLDLLISFAAVSTGALPVLFYSLYALLKDGKIFYPEIVIGKFGKPFILNKFNERAQNRSITDKIFYLFFFHKWTMFAAIFMGQMSLVGPQLHGWREVKGALRRKAAYRRRFLLKPGLTGPAQMAGFYRKEKLPLEEEVENDVYYWHHLSLALDIKILFNSLSLILLRIAGRVIND